MERGVIVPVRKKKEKKEVQKYRGLTFMPTLYKVYAMVLTKRLKKETEKKE